MSVKQSALSRPYLHDEAAAYEFVEKMLWADGRPCPHCGVVDESVKLQGKSTRMGVYKCRACRKPFSVKVGTIFEASHIPLHKWLQAIFLLSSSKKGISSNQLARTLEITLRSAWFVGHRIREAMAGGFMLPMGGEGEVIEADEVYLNKPVSERATHRTSGQPYTGGKHGRGLADKRAVVSLVQRGGSVRSFHVERADKATIASVITKNVKPESKLHTDESRLYRGSDAHVSEHQRVHHAKGEYSRDGIHTNSVDGYFSIFRRGFSGIYQHCSEKHLHRYLSEYDFRYNAREALGVNDEARAVKALKGIVGKRLTYRTTRSAHAKQEAQN